MASSATQYLHETLLLYITDEKFFLVPQNVSGDALLFDRITHEFSLHAITSVLPLHGATSRPIYGVIGILNLIAGPYLLVITEREKIGELRGHAIWRMTNFDCITCFKNLNHLSEKQIQSNSEYECMMRDILRTESFYFSYTFDLTHNLQRVYSASPEFSSLTLMERADERFLWNAHVLRDLCVQRGAHPFCLPLVHGFIEMKRCMVDGRGFDLTLISRRSHFRAGVRLHTRGVDREGHVANYVETEQIVETPADTASHNGRPQGTNVFSFVQTRGSIPLFWTQKPNLKYKPKFRLTDASENAFFCHFDSQVLLYRFQVILNLINQTGGEKALGSTFKDLSSRLDTNLCKYVDYDFHHECRNMQWNRLNSLMDTLSADVKRIGYLKVSHDKIQSEQQGVFRTNCIDCLDRTNVVQSMLARCVLQEQLEKVGILSEGRRIQDISMLESVFRNLWADNADHISKQYSGTGALKTDFTRTGKRSALGMLNDLVNSGTRYFMNNFLDGTRQDSLDLFVGNYQVSQREDLTAVCPLRRERPLRFYVLLASLIVSLAMCVLSVLLGDWTSYPSLFYSCFWGFLLSVSLYFVFLHGVDFVNYPRLRKG